MFLFLISLPFLSSLIVRLYAWLLILKPSGILNPVLMGIGVIREPLEILYTPVAVGPGMVYVMVPVIFLPLHAAVDNLDAALVEASGDLGASEWVTWHKVLLPQLAPGLIGGAMLAFVISMEDLVITCFVAGTDSTALPGFVFGMVRRWVKPEINAIATLIILAPVVIAAYGWWLRARKTD